MGVPLENLRTRGFTEDEYPDEELIEAWALIWSIINLFTNRNYVPTSRTLHLDGDGTSELWFPIEIISISSVSETYLGSLTEDTDYVVYNRQVPDDREYPKIMLQNGAVFPKGNQNITVVGRFGYVDENSPSEMPPLPLIEVAKRLMPIAFENILEDGDRVVDVSISKRNVRRESTDRWSYTKFDKGGIENQLLDDPIMNGILLKFYKGIDIVSCGWI